MNFSTDIHVPQRRNPTDFGDQPTFFLKPVWVPFSGFGEVSQQLLHRRPEVQPCGDTNIVADSCRVLLIQRYSAIFLSTGVHLHAHEQLSCGSFQR